MAAGSNILFILSDEHNRAITGCYGNTIVQTPNIDRLARRGTRFTNAYCNSPICVPARASLATGRHIHDLRCWDNAHPYHGQVRSWHHELRDAGYDVVSFGKLHFRSTDDDNGFTEERLPLHIVGGVGDLKGSLREPVPEKSDAGAMAADVGAGDSTYGRYDHAICEDASAWIEERGQAASPLPFALFVSFVRPHFPLIGPSEHYALYAERPLEELQLKSPRSRPDHSAIEEMARFFAYDQHFTDQSRAEALRGYYAMVTDLDAAIGRLVASLEAAGFGDTTHIIYTSDHGDNLGSRGFWGKSLMYEDSVAIPLIATGPRFPQGTVSRTPVSLNDIFPTMQDLAGLPADAGLPGQPLVDLVDAGDPDRPVLSQYHAAGSPTGIFMLRRGRWKYIHYVGHRPQLFDLEADPYEVNDLGESPEHAETRSALDAALRDLIDPEATSEQAFADQRALISAAGGREAVLARTDIPYTPAPAG